MLLLGGAAGLWMCLTAVRLWRTRHSAALLLAGPELLAYSIVVVAGAIWALSLGVPAHRSGAFLVVGLVGLVVWWRGRRTQRKDGSWAD